MSDSGGLGRFRGLGDEELIRLAGELDPGAFEVLYERHHVLAFSFAVRIVGSRDQAQSVVEVAFLDLWRDARRYDSTRGSVRSWLMGMVRDRAIDAIREVSARQRVQAEEAPRLGRPAPIDEASADPAPAIRAALEKLPSDQRRIIELAFYGGWTESEIAEQLGQPLGTVKSGAHLGLLTLRDALLSELEAPS
ncbi:MAG: sigma-70 family RNA polymerase sigma factor [Actinomycetota bacterium]|nr:sigma-70 family RNA polymerase sigma factor [Actinomycetota bacterium]